jgi:hypothetical protein
MIYSRLMSVYDNSTRFISHPECAADHLINVLMVLAELLVKWSIERWESISQSVIKMFVWKEEKNLQLAICAHKSNLINAISYFSLSLSLALNVQCSWIIFCLSLFRSVCPQHIKKYLLLFFWIRSSFHCSHMGANSVHDYIWFIC